MAVASVARVPSAQRTPARAMAGPKAAHAAAVAKGGAPAAGKAAAPGVAKAGAAIGKGAAGKAAGAAAAKAVALRAAGATAARAVGALGGPVGQVVTTCAFEGGYQAGKAYARATGAGKVVPPYPGGNKVLKRQPNGDMKWVDAPKATRIQPNRPPLPQRKTPAPAPEKPVPAPLPKQPAPAKPVPAVHPDQKKFQQLNIEENQKQGMRTISPEAAELEQKGRGKSADRTDQKTDEEVIQEKLDEGKKIKKREVNALTLDQQWALWRARKRLHDQNPRYPDPGPPPPSQ